MIGNPLQPVAPMVAQDILDTTVSIATILTLLDSP